jgi:hypothetical protein
MLLTVIHTGEQVEVEHGLVAKAIGALSVYLSRVRVDRREPVKDALYELRHGRTVSTEAAGINERVDPSLLTCTYYNQEGW